jgi:hypothetical protein
MKKRSPQLKLPGKFNPPTGWFIWYFLVTLMVLWGWQELFQQFAVRTIPYSQLLARQMIALYGMSQLQRDCSEQTAREIDEEVKKLLDRCYVEAKEILNLHRDQHEQIAAELLRHETIDGARFYQLIGNEMPRPKEPVPPLEVAVATAPNITAPNITERKL